MQQNQGARSQPAAWAAILVGLFALAATAGACGTRDDATTERDERNGRPPTHLATAEFDVKGMTCAGCALATETALRRLDGVADADVQYDERTDNGRCTVEYDPERVDPEQMMAAVRELGYDPTLLAPEAQSEGAGRPDSDRAGHERVEGG